MAPTKSNKGKKKPKHQPRNDLQASGHVPFKSAAESALIPKVVSGLKWLEWRDLALIPTIKGELKKQLSAQCSDRVIMHIKNDTTLTREYNNSWIGLMIGRDFTVDDPDNESRYDLLVSLLTSVRTITIDYHERLETVFPDLVACWVADNDRIGQIHIDGGQDSSMEVRTAWYTAISSIRSLRILYWLNTAQLPPLFEVRHHMLQHVERLSINNYRWELVPLLQQTGLALQSLMLTFSKDVPMNCNTTLLQLLLANNKNIGKHLVHFAIKWEGGQVPSEVSPDEMFRLHALVCKHFVNLEKLDIPGLSEVSLELVLAHLTGLPHLHETTLDSELHQFVTPKSVIFNPFTSILRITLGRLVSLNYTFAQFTESFARLFPELESLYIRTDNFVFAQEYNRNAARLFPRMTKPEIIYVVDDDILD